MTVNTMFSVFAKLWFKKAASELNKQQATCHCQDT